MSAEERLRRVVQLHEELKREGGSEEKKEGGPEEKKEGLEGLVAELEGLMADEVRRARSEKKKGKQKGIKTERKRERKKERKLGTDRAELRVSACARATRCPVLS
eukprot:1803363-Rhodomonas_salina.2